MSFEKKLAAWIAAGLISQDQAHAIMVHERATPQRPWALFGIAGIGVVALITGIISLVAANWEDIPDAVKLASYILLQGALGLALLVSPPLTRAGLARETVLTSYALLFLAGIGLVGQVFHLSGSDLAPVLFWLGLAALPMFLASSRLLPHLWLAAVGLACQFWIDESELALALRYAVALALPFGVAAVGFWRHPNLVVPPYFARACRQWSMVFLFVVLPGMASVVWADDGRWVSEGAKAAGALIPWLGVVLALGSLVCASPSYPRRVVAALAGGLVAIAVFVSLPFLQAAPGGSLGALVLYMLIWSAAAAAAAFAGYRRLFDVATFFIASRLVVAYFEVFGSLAATGLGLIVSGILILVVALGWYRGRDKVAAIFLADGRPDGRGLT